MWISAIPGTNAPPPARLTHDDNQPDRPVTLEQRSATGTPPALIQFATALHRHQGLFGRGNHPGRAFESPAFSMLG